MLKQVDTLISEKTPFISVILRGIGQVMLQENSITGLLFLIGIFIGSYNMGLATLLAVISGNIIAIILKYDKKKINAGLYGFSPALVGVALMLFYEPQTVIWLSVIVGSILSAMLQHFFSVRKMPAFTFPFVLITWIILYIFNNIYPINPPSLINTGEYIMSDYIFAFRGIGQVIFQDKLIVGIIFLIGILVNSPVAALYALLASLMSGVMAGYLDMSIDSINMGLFSYNAVLCAIVFADKNIEGVAWAALSVVLSLFIAIVMFQIGLTQLTFPFVAATVVVLNVKNKISKSLIS